MQSRLRFLVVRSHTFFWWLVLGCVSWMLVTRSARAGDPRGEATEFFRRGRDAYSARDFSGAARAFEAAYEKVPRAAAIYNAALAWVLAKEPAHAANAFQIALEKTDLHGAEADDARTRLAKLQPELATLEVSAPPGSRLSVPPLSDAPCPARTFLMPGAHELQVRFADARTVTRSVHVVAGQHARESFDPLLTAVSANAAQSPGESSGAAGLLSARPLPSDPTPLLSERSSSKNTRRTIGWVLLSVAAASTGAAVLLGLEAVSSRDAFVASDEMNADAHSDAVRLRTMTNVAWGSAALLAGVGTVLVLTSGK